MADERNVTLRGLELGDGTYYPFAAQWIDGLGIPPARTFDQPRGALAGDVGGDDVPQKRIITISIGLQGNEMAADAADGTTPLEAAMQLFDDLKTAWRTSTVNIPLTVTMGTYWERVYQGRPRHVDDDMSRACDGVIRALLTFECLEVYAEGETVDFVVGSS